MQAKSKDPPEVRALLERARKNEKVPPRKHHLVPDSYLQRWSEIGRIRVTEVESRRTFQTSPSKAARVTDFYRLEADGLDPSVVPPLLFETMLSEIEGWAKTVIDELVTHPVELEPDLAAKFAWFLGFQFTRGASHRAELRTISNEFFKIQYLDMNDEGIRKELRRRGANPTDELVRQTRDLFGQIRGGVVTIEPQQAALVAQAGVSAAEVGEYFLRRAWIICRTHPVLVTSDEPVVPVGGPGSERNQRAGIATAGVILFPLSPEHLLVMLRSDLAAARGLEACPQFLGVDELDCIETIEVCQELVMNSYRWAFERPSKTLVSKFYVPPRPAPMAIEDVGRIQEGTREGALIRTYAPSRWRNHPAPLAWPLSRYLDA